MFVGRSFIISLEYIFYQKDGFYSKIEKNKKDNVNLLGTENFEAKNTHDVIKCFSKKPTNFHDSKIQYLSQHQAIKEKKNYKKLRKLTD